MTGYKFPSIKLIYSLLFTICCLGNLFAQDNIIKGTVCDEKGTMVPWVNIGIRNKDFGTVSNESGKFELRIPLRFQGDTLLFSAVGFKEVALPVADMMKNKSNRVILSTKAYELNQVVIHNTKRKKAILGTASYTPMMWVSISLKGSQEFAEQAQLIKINAPVQVLSANVRVEGNKQSRDSITYRLNIYKVQDGIPGARLIEKNLIKTFPETAKTLTFNLEDESIFIDEDFVVSFEYIPRTGTSKKNALSLRASIGGKGGFSRLASIGKWLPVKGGGAASIFVVVEH